jgi:hemoglobin
MTVDALQRRTDRSTPVSEFERIGGTPKVRRAVDRFYDLVLADPALLGYFHGVNLIAIKRHQVALLTQLLGGPSRYTGEDLTKAHRHLSVRPEDFDRVGVYLTGSLWELGAGPDVVLRISAALTTVRDQIVVTPPTVGSTEDGQRRAGRIGYAALAAGGWLVALAALRRRAGRAGRTNRAGSSTVE